MILKCRLNKNLLSYFTRKRVYERKIDDPKFTQRSLARIAGVDAATFSNAINGDEITVRTLEKVLSVLKIPNPYLEHIFVSKNDCKK